MNDEDGDPGRPPRVLAAAAYASARNAASEDRVRRSGEAGDSRASYTDLDAERLPGWERPAVALLSNLLVPLSLWLVALSKDDLLHAALLFAFLMTLVWPGDTGVLRNTGRVIAVALSLMYPWALDHVPELTGLNRESWVPALKLVGLWQPDVVRAMVPMACILVINCLVLNLPKVVEILLPLDREETGTDADDVDARRGERRPTTGVTWEAFWALATASAAEAWLFTVRLVDGMRRLRRGSHRRVSSSPAGECSLLNLAFTEARWRRADRAAAARPEARAELAAVARAAGVRARQPWGRGTRFGAFRAGEVARASARDARFFKSHRRTRPGPPRERADVPAVGPQRAGHRHALPPHRRAVVGVGRGREAAHALRRGQSGRGAALPAKDGDSSL